MKILVKLDAINFKVGSRWIKLIYLFVVWLLVAGCGQSNQSFGGVVEYATLDLPTEAPTLVPSPVSTRVMPVEVLTPAPTFTITPIPDKTVGLVVNVIDGNTIAVVMDGDPIRLAYEVRYVGIEAPPNSSDDPWGVVAYETNHTLTNLKVVRLVRDQTDFDDDGYLLRYVYVGDQLLNTELVERGLARAVDDGENSQFKDKIIEAEAQAKQQSLGVWGEDPPTPTPASLPTPETEEEGDAEELITPQVSVTLAATQTVTATVTAETTATATATRTLTPTATDTPNSSATTPASDSDLRGP